MELVPGGSLKRIVYKYKGLEEPIIQRYTIQILQGLEYLHANWVIHRDLKCANLLINHDGIIKLTDFGSSRLFENNDENISKSLKGSPYWMAPEVANKEGHSFSADIWSLGCCLIEMLQGYPAWSKISKDANEVMKIIGESLCIP